MLSGGAFRSSWCPANKRPRWRFAPPNPTNLSDFMVSGYSIVPGRPPAHGRTITAETPTDKQRTDHARQPPCVKSATGIASAGIACRHNMKANEPGPTATQHRPQHRPIAPVRAAPGAAAAIRNAGQPRWRAPPKRPIGARFGADQTIHLKLTDPDYWSAPGNGHRAGLRGIPGICARNRAPPPKWG
jgi:hypothetical protein